MIFLKEDERLDDLQRDGLKIIQNKTMFSFGVDAVLLANSVITKENDIILDLGTGTGIIPLLLSTKTNAKKIVGVEIQKEVADMANRSVNLNKLNDKIQIINQDFREYTKEINFKFDIVVSNPPYFKSGGGMISGNKYKMISRHEITMNMDSLFESATISLKRGGSFYLIHRPERLVDIFNSARKYSLEPKRARMINPKPNTAFNLILIKCVKDAGSEIKWDRPLNIYDETGDYSQEIYEIYSKTGISSFAEKE